jgi:putative ABC transport system substrate-binding protein
MKKDIVCLALGAVLFTLCVPAEAQQPAKVPRIGYLSSSSSFNERPRDEAFRQGLRELGHVEGKNVVIEYRYANGKLDQLSELAAELVHLKVDVIVTSGGPPTQAAKNATKLIPIVMTNISDPAALGFVASLARPGQNMTGLSSMQNELGGRRLELLKEIVPQVSRVAVLVNRDVPGYGVQMKEVEAAAKVLGLRLQPVDVRSADDLQSGFSAMVRKQAGALIGLNNPTFNILQGRIADLALKNRLPTVYGQITFAQAGGLMSYAPDVPHLYRRAATYVDKILKGTKPADLPVEQPMKFELVINLKTAKQIGLTIPQSVLYRADKVIR